ncbi:uncharacterized protein [Parasteatoda tepidariorum]|uniref:uncharacterized protein isoform X2 n=1 Tax=Parasteatoda tepidariorum TaxID=114398 RepID=UPI001C7236DD|nr:uncharacterized protein LOC107443680 [Parasteatoda tepidariorum]
MNSEKREFVFTWRIENVSFGERRYIGCPEFQAECLGQTRWKVDVCPIGYQNESSCRLIWFNAKNETSNTLELYDISKSKSVGKDVIGHRFELHDINGVLFRSSDIQTFIDEGYCYKYIYFKDIGLERDLKDLPEDIIIVRCVLMRMKVDSSSENFNSCLENQRADEAKSDCECNTIHGVDTFTCTYKDLRALKGEKVVPTPTRFCINFSVNEKGEVYVSFYTKRAQDVIYVSFKISLICPDGAVAKVLLDTPTQYLESVGRDRFCIGRMDDKYYLKCETKSSNSVRFDTVSYSPACILNATESSAHSSENNEILANTAEALNPEGISISTQTEESNVDFKSQELMKFVHLPLQDDLCKLLKNETFTDVTLKSENVIMPAHKALLAARSPVFSAMFHQDMLESQSGTIYLSDVDVETLKLFLEYIYTDTVEMKSHENVIKLMIIADKYQVIPLKEGCSAYLKTILSDENVCDVIAVADMVNQEDLKLCAMAYIKANVSKILSTSKWKKWLRQNLELAADIVAEVSS